MTRDEIISNIRSEFQKDILDYFEKSPKRIFIALAPQAIAHVALHVFNKLGARFNSASGVDARDHMEILYHFTFDEVDCVISFRVKLDKTHLEIDSLTPLFKGADWIEREMKEMLGIKFKGHPNLRRLLLPEDWPEGVYPLRTDYNEWDKNAIRDRGV